MPTHFSNDLRPGGQPTQPTADRLGPTVTKASHAASIRTQSPKSYIP